jgi:hypothetical protein
MPIERCTATDLCTELQRHLVEPGKIGLQVTGVEKVRGRRTHALAVCNRTADKVTILTNCPHCGANLRELRGWMQDAGAAKPKAVKP